jgi:hypothetical protein
MFDEASAYKEIVQAVYKTAGVQLESGGLQFHSRLSMLSDDLRRHHGHVMRILASMKEAGVCIF